MSQCTGEGCKHCANKAALGEMIARDAAKRDKVVKAKFGDWRAENRRRLKRSTKHAMRRARSVGVSIGWREARRRATVHLVKAGGLP